MKSFILKFAPILIITAALFTPVFAGMWDEPADEWAYSRLDRAQAKVDEGTKNPIKKVWRKIVLWDAKNASNVYRSYEKAATEEQKRRINTYNNCDNCCNNTTPIFIPTYTHINPVPMIPQTHGVTVHGYYGPQYTHVSY